MTDGQKIKFLVEHLCGGNQARFARETGIEKTVLNRLVRDSGDINGIHLTETYIRRITNKFPEVDQEWLRTGKGNPGEISASTVRAKYLTIIMEKDKEIAELKAENLRLNKILDKLLQ